MLCFLRRMARLLPSDWKLSDWLQERSWSLWASCCSAPGWMVMQVLWWDACDIFQGETWRNRETALDFTSIPEASWASAGGFDHPAPGLSITPQWKINSPDNRKGVMAQARRCPAQVGNLCHFMSDSAKIFMQSYSNPQFRALCVVWQSKCDIARFQYLSKYAPEPNPFAMTSRMLPSKDQLRCRSESLVHCERRRCEAIQA